MKSFSVLFKKIIIYPTFLFLMLAPLSPAFAAEAGVFGGKCVGRDAPGYAASDVPTIQGLECLVANILANVITLIGIASFVMFLLGGFRYLTAGANAKGMEAGKNSISFAILGIILALASFLILNILAEVTGVKTILQFNTQFENIKPNP